MKLSLPLLLVICLVGYGYSTDLNNETKTKVICEDCEYTHLSLNENALDKMRLVKLQNCLVQKKRQANRDDQEKNRIARSANDQEIDSTTFDKLFPSSATFKRVLTQYLKLKDSIVKKTAQLQQEVGQVLADFADDYEAEKSEKKPLPQTPSLKETVEQNANAKCEENKLTCSSKPNHVIRIKSALLTSQNNQKMCAKSVDWSFNLRNLDESCFETIKTTRKLAELCDGEKECEVSIATQFNTICDCTEKRHMEVEYTCEPESEETSQKRSKRALYYQNDNQSQRSNNRYRNMILDYYDRFYDYSDYYAYDYCDEYYNYYDDYYDSFYSYYYGFDADLCNYDYAFALSAKGNKGKYKANKELRKSMVKGGNPLNGLEKLSAGGNSNNAAAALDTADAAPSAASPLSYNGMKRRRNNKNYSPNGYGKYGQGKNSFTYKKRRNGYGQKKGNGNRNSYGSRYGNGYSGKSYNKNNGYPRNNY